MSKIQKAMQSSTEIVHGLNNQRNSTKFESDENERLTQKQVLFICLMNTLKYILSILYCVLYLILSKSYSPRE